MFNLADEEYLSDNNEDEPHKVGNAHLELTFYGYGNKPKKEFYEYILQALDNAAQEWINTHEGGVHYMFPVVAKIEVTQVSGN